MKVGIIPARGGSKGLAGKNTKLMCGRPLISHTIQAALRSLSLGAVFVSTEDDEIDAIAQRDGAKVIRHPPELSGNDSPTTPVIAWDLDYLERSGMRINIVVVMRATTPLRTTEDIDAAVGLLESSPAADSVVSVTSSNVNPVRLKRILSDGRVENAFGGEGRRPLRRQEFEAFFVRNGGIYVARRSVVNLDSLWGDYCLAYQMPPERSVNINTEFDFLVAELLMASRDVNRPVIVAR